LYTLYYTVVGSMLLAVGTAMAVALQFMQHCLSHKHNIKATTFYQKHWGLTALQFAAWYCR
jgi:hypothetical protein